MPAWDPELGAGSETAAEPALVVEASPGQGRPRGRRPGTRAATRRPPLPPRPALPPPSLLPPGAQQPPPPEPRAAREMAPVWPPHPEAASAGAAARDAPGPAAPRNSFRGHPPTWGAVPRGLSGPGPARDRHQPRAPNDNRGRREEGGGGRPPLATRSPARPPVPRPRARAPAGGSALNLKIKLVLGREERARPGEQAPLGGRRERCCVMVPTWTPAFCPFLLRKRRHAPEPRKAGFRVRAPQSTEKEVLGRARRFPRLLSPPPSPKHFNFLLPIKAQT